MCEASAALPISRSKVRRVWLAVLRLGCIRNCPRPERVFGRRAPSARSCMLVTLNGGCWGGPTHGADAWQVCSVCRRVGEMESGCSLSKGWARGRWASGKTEVRNLLLLEESRDDYLSAATGSPRAEGTSCLVSDLTQTRQRLRQSQFQRQGPRATRCRPTAKDVLRP